MIWAGLAASNSSGFVSCCFPCFWIRCVPPIRILRAEAAGHAPWALESDTSEGKRANCLQGDWKRNSWSLEMTWTKRRSRTVMGCSKPSQTPSEKIPSHQTIKCNIFLVSDGKKSSGKKSFFTQNLWNVTTWPPPMEVNGREKERKPAPAQLGMWRPDPNTRHHHPVLLETCRFWDPVAVFTQQR